jgi:hypothetical protein
MACAMLSIGACPLARRTRRGNRRRACRPNESTPFRHPLDRHPSAPLRLRERGRQRRRRLRPRVFCRGGARRDVLCPRGRVPRFAGHGVQLSPRRGRGVPRRTNRLRSMCDGLVRALALVLPLHVGQVPSCPVTACDGCTTEAINKNVAAQYMTAFTRALASGSSLEGCGCPCESGAVCRNGICQAAYCGPSPADTLAACADAGGQCFYRANATCNGLGPPDACAYDDEFCCIH